MPESLTLRIRHPQGISTIDKLSSTSTISDLKHEISNLIKSDPNELLLRVGFPPAPVIVSDETHLDDAQISTGDTIIVEVHEIEESKVQEKPLPTNISKPTPVIPSKNEPIKTATELPKKTQPSEIYPPVSVIKQNEYLKDMPLTDDEFNQQLAKALQESISTEISNQKKNDNKSKKIEEEEEDNLFAEIDSKPVTNSRPQPKQENKVDIEADIEFARKLQEELNSRSTNNNRFNPPQYQQPQRFQPTRQRMDIEYDYEPGDFYDTTKQYNIENNLPEDAPLKDYDDYDNRNYDRDMPHVVGRKIVNNEADQDEQLQKAIQNSLNRGGALDFDEIELMRIIEQSKREK